MMAIPDGFYDDIAQSQAIVDRLCAESKGLNVPAVYVAVVLAWGLRQLDSMTDDQAEMVANIAEVLSDKMASRVNH